MPTGGQTKIHIMKTTAVIFTISALMFSCANNITANYNVDPEADFSKYTSFYWDDPLNKAANESHNPIVNNSLVNKQVKENIETQMQGRGYALTENNPDILINFHIMVENKSKVTSSYPNSYYFWWRNDIQTINYKEGTLIIDLIDAKTDQLIWQGYSTGTITRSDMIPSIKETVLKIFSKFQYRNLTGDGSAS